MEWNVDIHREDRKRINLTGEGGGGGNLSLGPLQKASTNHYTIQIQKVLFLLGHLKNNKHTL